MLALFLVFSCFCSVFWFLSCFLFCLQSMKKVVFPAILLFFWVMLVKRVVWFFMCYVFVLVCFLVLLVSIFKNSFVLFCFCVVVVTRLSGLLVCILWSFFLFCVLLFCFEFVFFCFCIAPKKTQKTGQQKPPKTNMQKKRTKQIYQLAQLCSQIVFFNFWGGLKIFIVWLKTP